MSTGGGGGRDDHKTERSLLSFCGYELYHHLRHINSYKEEAMESLIYILYNMVDGIIYKVGPGKYIHCPGGICQRRRGMIRISIKQK